MGQSLLSKQAFLCVLFGGLFIIPFLLLVGCESGLDKCMNTELPRAEKIAGLPAEREAGLQLLPIRKLLVVDAEYVV